MKIEAEVRDVCVDAIDVICANLKNNTKWQLMAYEGVTTELNELEEKPCIGLWLEAVNQKECCTIMMDLTIEEALFFAKSLQALAESMK